MSRNRQLNVKVTAEVRERMEEIAEEEGETLSTLAWRAICEWLDDFEDEESPSGRASLAASALDRVLWDDELLERAGINDAIITAAIDELVDFASVADEIEIEDEDEDQEELFAPF